MTQKSDPFLLLLAYVALTAVVGMAAYRIVGKDQAIESTEYLLKNLGIGGHNERGIY